MEKETIRLYREPYSNGFMPTMTPYLCEGGEKRGAVIIFPGGGYSHYGSAEQSLIARRFNELGFHAFVVIYSVAPLHYPAQMRDGFRAIKIVRANADKYNVEPDKIAVCGFSAGGHLAGSLGVFWKEFDSSLNDELDGVCQRPDAMILCYPVITMAGEFSHAGCVMNLLGNDDAEMREKLSLDRHVSSDTLPSFCWITSDDASVPRENPLMFANAMWQAGNDCELHIFPHGPHGLGLNTERADVCQWSGLAATFLRTTCKF